MGALNQSDHTTYHSSDGAASFQGRLDSCSTHHEDPPSAIGTGTFVQGQSLPALEIHAFHEVQQGMSDVQPASADQSLTALSPAASDNDSVWRKDGFSIDGKMLGTTENTCFSNKFPNLANDAFLNADFPDLAGDPFINADFPDLAGDPFINADFPDLAGDAFLNADFPDLAGDAFLNADFPDLAGDPFINADFPDLAGDAFLNADFPDLAGDPFMNADFPDLAENAFRNADVRDSAN